MTNSKIQTFESISVKIKPIPLRKTMYKGIVDDNLYLNANEIKKYKYLKGSKRVLRTRPNGEPYYYSEGNMDFPENISKPGRTMLTSEGTTNRSTPIIKDYKAKQLRKLLPIEAERLNHFPDNWTNTGMSNRQRFFMMGNALVVKLVSIIRDELQLIIASEK